MESNSLFSAENISFKINIWLNGRFSRMDKNGHFPNDNKMVILREIKNARAYNGCMYAIFYIVSHKLPI